MRPPPNRSATLTAQAARAALERLQHRPYADQEWDRAQHDLTAFARLISRWHHPAAFPVAIPDQRE